MVNPFIESFNGSFRDECLNINWFLSLEDASISMTKHYARILDTTIGKEMSTLVDKFQYN
jgi:hypothetical protein